MVKKTHVFIFTAVLGLCAFFVSCTNVFTKREESSSGNGVSISLDLSGIAGQTISRTAAVTTSNFPVTVSVYDGTTVLDTQTAAMPLTGTSTLGFTNLTPGKTVTVQVGLYNGTELIYKRAASVTLVEGENKIAFDGSSPVLLYDMVASSPTINYTADYTSTAGLTALTGTPTSLIGTITSFCVDRTTESMYVLTATVTTTSDMTTYTDLKITKYTLDGTGAVSYTASESTLTLTSAPLLAANNGDIFAYI